MDPVQNQSMATLGTPILLASGEDSPDTDENTFVRVT